MMKIIIAGSRDFDDYDLLKEKLNGFINSKKIKRNDIEIISGGARGADKLGEEYAEEKNIELNRMLADWDIYGKRAAYIRNHEMSKVGDCLFAFWDGKSKGTKHMIREMEKEFKPSYIVFY